MKWLEDWDNVGGWGGNVPQEDTKQDTKKNKTKKQKKTQKRTKKKKKKKRKKKTQNKTQNKTQKISKRRHKRRHKWGQKRRNNRRRKSGHKRGKIKVLQKDEIKLLLLLLVMMHHIPVIFTNQLTIDTRTLQGWDLFILCKKKCSFIQIIENLQFYTNYRNFVV